MDVADEKAPHPAVANAARLALEQWMQRVGVVGLPAMTAHPALLARVDQHAAAIRDAIAGPDGTITAADLASYADGVYDSASRRGWRLAAAVRDANWNRASWPLLRLTAVCLLARDRTGQPPPSS